MAKRLLILLVVVIAAGFIPRALAAQTRSAFVAPRLGVWKVTGKDAENTGWSGRLHITRRQPSGRMLNIRGWFRWVSSDGETAGREYVSGRFDRSNGRLTLRGNEVKNERGEIMKTQYVAFVSKKGRMISRGRWFGEEVVEGSWRAGWLRTQ